MPDFTFRAHDSSEINALSRPLHVILLTLPHWIFKSIVLEIDSMEHLALYYARISSYIILMTLPLQWVMGFFPLFEPLILWMIEQVQVFLFGGTPTPSFFRWLGQILLSLVHLGIILVFKENQWIIVILW